jgi:NADH-quinone oxidoreductase subunit E
MKTGTESPSRTDALLGELELVAESNMQGSGRSAISGDLERFVAEARRRARLLKRDVSREQAVRDMVTELKEVDGIIGRNGNDRSRLNQILLDIQSRFNWLPRHALLWVSERLGVPLSEIYTVANFYEVLSLEPQGRHQCQVCMGTACHVRGAPQLLDRVALALGLKAGETDARQQFTLKTVNCLGCCALGPVLKLDKDYVSNPSTDELKRLLHELAAGDSGITNDELRMTNKVEAGKPLPQR